MGPQGGKVMSDDQLVFEPHGKVAVITGAAGGIGLGHGSGIHRSRNGGGDGGYRR